MYYFIYIFGYNCPFKNYGFIERKFGVGNPQNSKELQTNQKDIANLPQKQDSINVAFIRDILLKIICLGN